MIVGGGFIGLEVASSATQLGLEAVVIEAAEAPMPNAFGPAVGALLGDLHRDRGVELVTGSSVAAIEHGDGARAAVSLADGRTVRADVVLIAVGMAPVVEWLRGSGLRLDGGVVVDELCQTNAPGVPACGDCARWPNPDDGRRLRVEHWDVAARHGQAAARSALGLGEPFRPVPYFWSDQHGEKLQFAGWLEGADRLELDPDPRPTSFVARYFKGTAERAVLTIGRPAAIAEARRALRARAADAVVA